MERLISGIHTVAVGPNPPKMQLWPKLNHTLQNTAFLPDAVLMSR
jgi:hypothetical protein